MGKAEAVKNLAGESNEKDIDHIKALMGIVQAGKLNQIESLVTRITAYTDEIETSRHISMSMLRDVENAAKRVEAITAAEIKKANAEVRKANEELADAVSRATRVALRLEDVAKRPPWVTYLIVAFYSMLGAAVMAGVLYFKLPNYGHLTGNQVMIYKSIESLKEMVQKQRGNNDGKR